MNRNPDQDFMKDAVRVLGELTFKGNDCTYKIDQNSIAQNSERAIHYLMADVHRKQHKPDKRFDKVIDLDTQYVQLKLLPNQTLGPMHRDELEGRPDVYQKDVETHDGKDVNEQDLISSKDSKKMVLLRGRAGIGKSTLVQHLIWQWAKGNEWANHLKVIFLINLRYIMKVDRKMSLPCLLSQYSVYNTGDPNVIVDTEWMDNNQKEISLVLDGIDEIQYFRYHWNDTNSLEEFKCGNEATPLQWCFALMKRQILKDASIIVSSRPFADLCLITKDVGQSNVTLVELMGLTIRRVMDFVEKNVNESQIEDVKGKLKENPILLSVCAITFCCAALCQVLAGGADIPIKLTTYTQITAYIMQVFMQRSMQDSESKTVTDFYDSVKPTLSLLSTLASNGLLSTDSRGIPSLVFDENDFRRLGAEETEIHAMRQIGLLMDTNITTPEDLKRPHVLSQFVHLSMQEFLAMAGVLRESPEKVREIIEQLGASVQFNMALLFLYGLAFNEDNDPIKNIVASVVEDVKMKNDKKKALLEGVELIQDSLQALQVAHESQSSDIAKEVAKQRFEEHIHIKSNKLTVIDIFAISFLLKQCDSIHIIELENVGIDFTSMQEIAKLVTESNIVKSLGLADDTIDDHCIEILMDCIRHNTSVEILKLGCECLTDKGVAYVADALRVNETLKEIKLVSSHITDKGVKLVADSLKYNDTLEELCLLGFRMRDEGALAILNLSDVQSRLTIKIWPPLCEETIALRIQSQMGIKWQSTTSASGGNLDASPLTTSASESHQQPQTSKYAELPDDLDEVFRKNLNTFKKLHMNADFIMDLLQMEVITSSMQEAYGLANKTNMDKVLELMTVHLPTRDRQSKVLFLQCILLAEQKNILEEIGLNPPQIQYIENYIKDQEQP